MRRSVRAMGVGMSESVPLLLLVRVWVSVSVPAMAGVDSSIRSN